MLNLLQQTAPSLRALNTTCAPLAHPPRRESIGNRVSSSQLIDRHDQASHPFRNRPRSHHRRRSRRKSRRQTRHTCGRHPSCDHHPSLGRPAGACFSGCCGVHQMHSSRRSHHRRRPRKACCASCQSAARQGSSGSKQTAPTTHPPRLSGCAHARAGCPSSWPNEPPQGRTAMPLH